MLPPTLDPIQVKGYLLGASSRVVSWQATSTDDQGAIASAFRSFQQVHLELQVQSQWSRVGTGQNYTVDLWSLHSSAIKSQGDRVS